jgi:hypothetical protein
MACVLCTSNNEAEFPAEMVFHFPGQGLDRECIFTLSEGFGLLTLRLFAAYDTRSRMSITCKRRYAPVRGTIGCARRLLYSRPMRLPAL